MSHVTWNDCCISLKMDNLYRPYVLIDFIPKAGYMVQVEQHRRLLIMASIFILRFEAIYLV